MRLIDAKIGGDFFEFSKELERTWDQTAPFFTILIGPNATGKSRCLSNLANAFRKLNDKRTGRNLDQKFLLRFSNFQENHIVSNDDADTLSNRGLPQRVITISNSLYDKFPLKAKSDSDFYEYVGARDAGLDEERYSVYSFIDTLQGNLHDPLFVKKTIEVFDFVGLRTSVAIKLRSNRTDKSVVYQALFSAELNKIDVREAILKTSRIGRLSKQHQTRITQNLAESTYVEGLIDFLYEMRAGIVDEKEFPIFEIDLKKINTFSGFVNKYKYFSLLRILNILSYDKILVGKKGNSKKYNILDSSSGEVNFLTSFVRAVPHLADNSLLLVDEPEISLHPNWQLRYTMAIKKLLSGFNGCHVVIATHSPYLVSDANPDNCCVSKISSRGSKATAQLLVANPYGWSVEDILWNVFSVATTRNYYLANEIGDILRILAKQDRNPDDILYLQNKRAFLTSVRQNLKNIDPIKRVIDTILNKL